MPDITTKLQMLLDDSRLPDREETAFKDMLAKLDAGVIKELTPSQTTWVNDMYKRFDKEAEEASLNLFSSGQVPVGFKQPERDYEKMNRPLKPPGR